jgi:hypothetical protein
MGPCPQNQADAPSAFSHPWLLFSWSLAGRPLLLVFWATWCVNSHRQFQEFEATSRALSLAGPRVVLLSTDEVPELGEARRQMEGRVWEKDAGPADPGAWSIVVDEIFGESKEFPLPTSLLWTGGPIGGHLPGPGGPGTIAARYRHRGKDESPDLALR